MDTSMLYRFWNTRFLVSNGIDLQLCRNSGLFVVVGIDHLCSLVVLICSGAVVRLGRFCNLLLVCVLLLLDCLYCPIRYQVGIVVDRRS